MEIGAHIKQKLIRFQQKEDAHPAKAKQQNCIDKSPLSNFYR